MNDGTPPHRMLRRAVAPFWAALLVATRLAQAAAPAPAPGKVDFARQVRPILAENCFECHGPDPKGRKGDLRLDARDGLFADRGGYRLVVPGNVEDSELIVRITSTEPDEVMPPPHSRRSLTPAQIDRLKSWVAEGAPWEEHWSFTPPRRPELPAVSAPAWCRSPIDRFILARLDRVGVPPSPEADRGTLARRLGLDLLGLPPEPDELAAFLHDDRAGAYERLVDRLLASPRFGERWARPWLDVVRYADSDGYEDDRFRPDAWRYRDWVIAAFNDDMPFDRFTTDQIAGDLAPNATIDQKIAAGYHRMAMVNRSAMGRDNEEEFRTKTVKDRAGTTATAWMGLTFGCAECHTHKYDPLPQRDYYRFYAFFDNLVDAEVPAPPLTGRHARAHQEAVREFEENQSRARTRLREFEAVALPVRQSAWEQTADPRTLPAAVAEALAIPPGLRTDEQAARLTAHFKTVDDEYLRLKAAVLDREMAANNRPPAPSAKALTVAESTKPRHTFLHLRGDFLSPGEEVRPGTPVFLPPLDARGKANADRRDLGRWLVSPGHPLTARVAANAVWQQLFGRGLVPTPEDFGLQGEPPSHPELLDWLAVEFRSSGWSRKGLIRTIVTSAVYRQSSRHRPELDRVDPGNSLLARQNRFRVDGEVVRDEALAVSGLLDPAIGGPSVQPPLPSSLLERADLKSERLMPPSKGADRYRRGVYVNVQRTLPYPMLKDFDGSDPAASCTRRERSVTPLQALTLLNDPAFAECARGLGLRLASTPGDVGERIRWAVRLCLSREPAPDESAELARVHDAHRSLYADDPALASALFEGDLPAGSPVMDAAAWVAVARTLLNLDEFVTRE